MGLGVADVFWAECLAIVMAAELAVKHRWHNLWIESDSQAAVVVLNSNSIPWRLRNGWDKAKRCLRSLSLMHVWREANITADQAASFAKFLEPMQIVDSHYKPDWIARWEIPYDVYDRVV